MNSLTTWKLAGMDIWKRYVKNIPAIGNDDDSVKYN